MDHVKILSHISPFVELFGTFFFMLIHLSSRGNVWWWDIVGLDNFDLLLILCCFHMYYVVNVWIYFPNIFSILSFRVFVVNHFVIHIT